MKPIKLSIQAFGPFAGKEEIDFTQLGKNPLFLINGPTGAGKSSILDAICFALYGATTGAERDATQMRCDHSDMSLLTEISLDFALGAKHYRIRRVPKQERAKSKGEGFTTQVAEAQLWELDGSENEHLLVPKSVDAASRHIKELIGLGIDQFRQVMVLPQGKFRELLMADSKDRENIFSQLFETHIYKKIENKLKDKAAGIKQAMQTHQDQVRGILQGAEVDSEPQINEELLDLTPTLAAAKRQKDEAQALLKVVEKEKDQTVTLNHRLSMLKVKQDELIAKQANAQEISKTQTRLGNATKAQGIYHLYSAMRGDAAKLEKLNNQHEASSAALNKAKIASTHGEQALEHAKLAAGSLDTLKAEQENLRRYQEQLTRLLQEKEGLAIALSKAAKSVAQAEDKKSAFEKLKQELSEKEILLAGYAIELAAFTSAQQTLKDVDRTLLERESLDRLTKQIQSVLTQKGKDEASVDSKMLELERARQHATKTEMAWHVGQAALLAAELTDQQPCPVCGSVSHPAPAKLSKDDALVSKTMVDDAREQEAKLRLATQTLKDALAVTSSQLDVLQSKGTDCKTRLGTDADTSIEHLKNQQQAALERISDLTLLRQTRESIDLRIAKIKSTQAESEGIFASLENQVRIDNTAATEAKTRVQQIELLIPAKYREATALNNEAKVLKATVDELSLNLQQAEAASKRIQSSLDQAIADEKALGNQRKEQEKLTTQSTALWNASMSASIFNNDDDFLRARIDDEQQSAMKHEIEAYHWALKNLEGAVKQLKSELEGKQHIDLSILEQKLSIQQQAASDAEIVWRQLDARAAQLISVKEKLTKAHDANESLHKEYAIYGTLNDVANGATGNKISLQRFVLSVLLDDVLIQASHRLHIMSKGRYQLVRKVDRAKGNKASGLELEVEDGDTGKPRAVATLSGGESFMAALSLALGLSDVVQSYAGGIKLDTLFIDEGFGSLDSDSLDAAIKVLIDLQASGRMIGIISHVSELKEQMANRVDVLSSKTGSSIKTVAS